VTTSGLQQGAIVGIGETRVGKFPGRTAVELQAEAVRRAMDDAQLEKSQIDALYALGSYISPIAGHALSVMEYLGIHPRLEGSFDVQGTPGFMVMLLDALGAMEDGRSDVAVITYGDNAATRRTAGSHGFVRTVESGTEDFEDPFGCSILSSYALLAQRYLEIYGLDAEGVFGPVALAMRTHAQRNDNALHRKPITMDDYRASPFISDPLRRLDCSAVVDGAGAIVIASKRVMAKRKPAHDPVSVLGAGLQATHKIVTTAPDIPELGMAEAARRAFAAAGARPEDVDLLTVHDGFSPQVLMSLEALTFCAPGRGGAFVADGGIDLNGSIPTNTHGGLMSQGHVGGILHIIEAVRQLRGEAVGRQVEGAELAAAAGNGGAFSICGVMLLGKGLAS
jgi:acetyl-CoA acetyltransferase